MKEKFLFKTDVLPTEIPTTFTNKNLFKIERVSSDNDFTIPYNFTIFKSNSINKRLMSLPHPIAQLRMSNFIESFKFNVTSFCSLSPFSIRSPKKINSINIELFNKKLENLYYNEQFFNTEDRIISKITHSDILEEYLNYFKYKKYSNLDQFLNSPIYHRSKSKYTSMMKLDIQNFFESIYTHSLEWALAGDKFTVKSNGFGKSVDYFPKALDNVCQKINYNETNGILVGPEFSRIVAEILLTRIDLNIYRLLHEHGLIFEKDYLIYRYVDDYFVFFNNTSDNLEAKIKNCITNSLKEYKLSANDSKYFIVSSGEVTVKEENGVIKLKTLFNTFSKSFKKHSLKYQMKDISEFLVEFDNLILNHNNQKHKLVRYALKSLNTFSENELSATSKKLIYELSLYILNYSPEYYSVKYFYTFFLKNMQIHSSSLGENEDIFEFMVKALKQNAERFDEIYDLLLAMKFLEKKVAASFLCSLLETFKHNYFCICTIALYILNEQGLVQGKYIIVLRKIATILECFYKDYSLKSKHKFQDAEFFYLINDFYHYPGFNHYTCTKFKKDLDKTYKEMKKSMSNALKDFGSEVDHLVERSYFNWKCDFKWFLKKSILKSQNIFSNGFNEEY